MANWLIEIEKEFKIIESLTHTGKTRVSARRIAGYSLKEFYNSYEINFIVLLQKAMADDALPKIVNEAAFRLQSRVDEKFNSQSIDPIADAKIIYEFVKEKIPK